MGLINGLADIEISVLLMVDSGNWMVAGGHSGECAPRTQLFWGIMVGLASKGLKDFGHKGARTRGTVEGSSVCGISFTTHAWMQEETTLDHPDRRNAGRKQREFCPLLRLPLPAF